MNKATYEDRRDAGQQLADELAHYADRPDVVVLGLSRGGVPVALEVAKALGAPLDVFVVRKLGAPGNPELAMGAIASGGSRQGPRNNFGAAELRKGGLASEWFQRHPAA